LVSSIYTRIKPFTPCEEDTKTFVPKEIKGIRVGDNLPVSLVDDPLGASFLSGEPP